MKTPDEIAHDQLTALDLGGDLTEGVEKTAHDLTDALQSGWIDGETILNMIQAGIEADRKRPRFLLQSEHDDVGVIGYFESREEAEADARSRMDMDDGEESEEWPDYYSIQEV